MLLTFSLGKSSRSRLGVGDSATLRFETMIPTKGKLMKWELEVFPKGLAFQDVKLIAVCLQLMESCHVDKFQIYTAYKIRNGGGDAGEPLDIAVNLMNMVVSSWVNLMKLVNWRTLLTTKEFLHSSLR